MKGGPARRGFPRITSIRYRPSRHKAIAGLSNEEAFHHAQRLADLEHEVTFMKNWSSSRFGLVVTPGSVTNLNPYASSSSQEPRKRLRAGITIRIESGTICSRHCTCNNV
jgi:hypothetical protein